MTIREENVHDRDPDCQGHVSAFPFTPFAIASESLAGQLSPHCIDAWTFCFKSVSVSVCVCLSVCVSVCLSVSAGHSTLHVEAAVSNFAIWLFSRSDRPCFQLSVCLSVCLSVSVILVCPSLDLASGVINSNNVSVRKMANHG